MEVGFPGFDFPYEEVVVDDVCFSSMAVECGVVVVAEFGWECVGDVDVVEGVVCSGVLYGDVECDGGSIWFGDVVDPGGSVPDGFGDGEWLLWWCCYVGCCVVVGDGVEVVCYFEVYGVGSSCCPGVCDLWSVGVVVDGVVVEVP